LPAFLDSAELPDRVLADFIGLVGVRGHRQHRDYRSYHKGSHLDASLPPRSAREVNIRIMANPPAVIFETDHPGSKHACAYQTRTPENIVEGVYAAFQQPKIWRVVSRMHP
jgi:hypothetical protein